MADKSKPTGSGSITQPADNKDERISEISNINRSISKMQNQVDQKLSEIDNDASNAKQISSIQGSMNKVLQKLSYTVGDIGKGFAKISTDVARGGKDALADYGKAISQDINYNKQNIVAMALGKSTPIYGYFISKFMETDVWRNAADKMKANIGRTLSSVGQNLKDKLSGLRPSNRKKKDTDSLSKQVRSVKVPQMAKGGVVEKAGLARLHAAEVVMPVEKLLSRIDEQISVGREMVKTMEKGQIHALAKMHTYVGSMDSMEKTGIFKGMFKALRQVQTRYEQPAQTRMLRALLAIQEALGAQVGTWTQVWQKMIVTNPTFRNMALIGQTIYKTLGMPFKPMYAFFKGRGGYQGHLSNSNQPLVALSENMGVLYTGSMHRLDRITMYTMATAEATRDLSAFVTSKNYEAIPGIKTGRWSLFGAARGMGNWLVKQSVRGAGRVSAFATGDKSHKQISDDLAEKLTKTRTGFWDKIMFRGQQHKLAGGLGEIKDSGKAQLTQAFSSKKLLNYVNKYGMVPVEEKGKLWQVLNSNQIEYKKTSTVSKKMLAIEDKKWRLNKKGISLSKKILEVLKDNAKENKQANERERRRSIFGFLSGGFGAVKGILSSVMSSVLPIFLGMDLFGGSDGLGGTVVNIIKRAFLGKAGAKGGISILGSMAKRVGSFIKGISLKFPKGFLSKLAPSLLSFPKTILSTIMKLFTSPAILTALGSGLAVAAAGALGFSIGKVIDKTFGITKKINEIQDSVDKKHLTYVNASAGKDAADREKGKTGKKSGYENYYRLNAKAQFGKTQAERSENVGFSGRRYMAVINEAQKNFMGDHIGEYMNYSPSTITAMRKEWLAQGGTYTRNLMEDPVKYGQKREGEFLKFLKAKGKVMNAEETKKQFDLYQKKTGISMFGKAMDKLPEIKDRAVGLYTRSYNIAKNEINEAIVTTQALKQKFDQHAKATIESGKEAAGKLGTAIEQNSIVVSNTISNTANSAMTGARDYGNRAYNTFNERVMSGDMDGD